MLFTMPMGGRLEIRPSEPIDELEIGVDEEVDGIIYDIYWDEIKLPWCTKTRAQAYAIALGCQWGAMEQFKKQVI